MPIQNYQILKQALNLPVACEWLGEDAKDDFFPDPLLYGDIVAMKDEYLGQRAHRMLQVDSIASLLEYAPKGNGMLREAIWLHPIHRILYLAALHRLLPKLDKELTPAVYSYRLDRIEDEDAYPFPNRTDRWKQFHNDFRSAALEPSTGAVLLTDIAAFYDHISVDSLMQQIEAMLGRSVDDTTRSVLQLLNTLLKLWSKTGFGIPQNYDPSSFLGSLYLHQADCSMLSKQYRYFRWVDDIRICAKDHDHAIRALHDLQSVLASDRLFLASDKTHIVQRGTSEFDALLDVADDVIISDAEVVIAAGQRDAVMASAETLFARLERHSNPEGDERKFRAFANRLLWASEYRELAAQMHPRVRTLVLPRLRSHPSRTDYWAKLLAEMSSDDVHVVARDLLVTRTSQFAWQRFHLWRMLTHLDALPQDLLSAAWTTLRWGSSILERAQSAVCIGRHGTDADRQRLFTEQFSAQMPFVAQRAIVIAVQEVSSGLRERYWSRALQINTDHQQLVTHLSGGALPQYGIRRRPVRDWADAPREIDVYLKSGVGLVDGVRTNFRLSRSHYDYE